jgi:hypothetical protein
MVLDGYASGPGATNRATALALTKVGGAASVVLVEGISDQIAVETAALHLGRDLGAERIVVLPIGGAHAIRRVATELGDRVRLAGLCDLAEEEIFRRGLAAGHPLEVCIADLEDELLRAVGTEQAEALFAAQGDLGAFRSLQSQPAWRGREPHAQMRRFLGSGSRRKSRYAQLLVAAACDRDALPRPLAALLARLS